jgi:hypothetical protein
MRGARRGSAATRGELQPAGSNNTREGTATAFTLELGATKTPALYLNAIACGPQKMSKNKITQSNGPNITFFKKKKELKCKKNR